MKNKFYTPFTINNFLLCSDEKVVKFIPLTTDSEEAKEAFQEGIYREDQNETNESRAAFKKAIELDENFLLAKIFTILQFILKTEKDYLKHIKEKVKFLNLNKKSLKPIMKE